jgi:hypothetical protein
MSDTEAEQVQQPGASQTPDAERQATELRKLLKTEAVVWPVANARQQDYELPVWQVLDMTRTVIEGLESDQAEIRTRLLAWLRKQPGKLPAALSALLPGVVSHLENRKVILDELLATLARLEASFEGDEARDDLLNSLATFAAVAAGGIPKGDE